MNLLLLQNAQLYDPKTSPIECVSGEDKNLTKVTLATINF